MHPTTIVWLSGWSVPASVWQTQTKYWPTHTHLLLDYLSCQTIEDFKKLVCHEIEKLASAPFIIVGWSLGAILALQLAPLFTPRLRGIFLVGATSSFVKTESNPYGWPKRVLDQMKRKLASAPLECLRAFDQQMFSACERAKGMDDVWFSLFRQQVPDILSLQLGLNYLQTAQIQPAFLEEQIPIYLLQGARDRITPPEAAQHLDQQLPQSFYTMMQNAGHLPFWTRPSAFAQWMRSAYEHTITASV